MYDEKFVENSFLFPPREAIEKINVNLPWDIFLIV